MLIAAVLTLAPDQPATLPANLGEATHAWFLDRVRSADPVLAEALHAPNARRPFTVSNLWGGRRTTGASVTLQPGTHYYLRITSVAPDLTALLVDKVLPALTGSAVPLLGAVIPIAGVATEATQHPWAGRSTYRSLLEEHTLAAAAQPRLTLQFASPTVFRSQGVNVPLPLPALVFDNLAGKWNQFAPIAIPPEMRRFAEESMFISRYRLWTERVAFGEEGSEGAYPGFVGVCSYGTRVRDRYWWGLAHLLGAFAFYAGVGAVTSRGLGQARLMPSRNIDRQDGQDK